MLKDLLKRAVGLAFALLLIPSVQGRAQEALDSIPDIAPIPVDSIVSAPDSVKPKKKDALDAPVEYESTDSMVWSRGGNASLFGNGKIVYQNIKLDAEIIKMQVDSSLVYADGVRDSAGNWKGTPIFMDGGTPYESRHMSYNFKTEKGYINEIVTQQGEGFMTSSQAKKGPEGEYYISDGVYTTCDDHDDPHFGIRITRAKVRPGKDVVFGPAILEVMSVPLPIVLPFGFFPFTESSYSSGIIVPSYGDELDRGFYLKDGGYYFALSDKMDLKVLGEVFTKGSWGLSAESNYRRRYKYSGNVFASTLTTKLGEKDMPDYSVTKNFKIRWTHRQDAKANPYQNFSASVNFATSSYERSNLSSLYNPALTSQSTRTSSISYSRSFPKIGLNMSSSFNLSQNMRDTTISMTAPSLSLSVNRFYPFKRKKGVGDERWYEKISMTYTGTLSNSITAKESEILQKNLARDWNNGMKHSIPVSATFQILKNINVTPSFNYTERWYTYRVNQDWDYTRQAVARDTVFGFNRVYNYNMAVSANTKLYGFYQPTKLWTDIFGDKLMMVRHVFTPSLSYSMTPDFSDAKYGFYDSYTYTDTEGEVHTVTYSPFQGSLYGVPGSGKSGSISLDVSNNVEMKLRSDKDTTGIKKISLIDELGGSISYNMAAATRPWSNLSTRTRIKLTKNYTFSLNATWATYAYEFNDAGKVVVGDRTEWSYGRFGRFQGMSQNFSYTFSNNTLREWKTKIEKLRNRSGDDEDEDAESAVNAPGAPGKTGGNGKSEGGVELDEDGYTKYTLPWSLSLSYGITMRENTMGNFNADRMRYPYKFTQNMNISGNFKLTNKWNFNYSSGWDFVGKDFTTTTMSVSRDLHCFTLSCSMVLKPYTSYNFTIQANSSMLSDLLRVKKRSSSSHAVNWYD
ncbi:MAG: LPS-assembly protein LptD [Bacteroidaceae bacterium]|nr:LPS-assembly protein LptD [Bacteroidaceae bacterium]